MIDNIERLFEQREFISKCKRLITFIAVCAIAAGILLVIFSPQIKFFVENILGRSDRPIKTLTWRSFIASFGIGIPLLCLFVLSYLYSRKIPEKIKINGLYFCIAGIFAALTYAVYVYGGQWINSDMSSEMVLGNLLAKENKLVTSSWEYSTELRLVYQQLFYMPLFKIFEDWRVVRTITTLLNNLVLLFSYFFMMKQFDVSKKTILFTSLFLILPVSNLYWGTVLFGGFYVFFIAMFFCFLGLLAILLNPTAGRKTAIFVLFMISSFLFGAGGVRALMDIHIPVFITVLCAYFFGKNAVIKPLILSVAALATCVLGYAVNCLLHKFYLFHSHNGVSLLDLSDIFFQRLGSTIYTFILFLGYTPDARFISLQGILGFLSVIIAFLIFYELAKIIKKRGSDNISVINVSFAVFFIVSSIYHVVIFQILKGDNWHLIPLYILYIPALAMIFEFVKKNMSEKKAKLFIYAILFTILGSGLINLYILPIYDLNNNRKDSISYIEKNNLHFGLASFWNANVLTELTNGQVEMLALSPKNIHRIHDWLHVIAYENPAYYAGETFLMLTQDEWKTIPDEKFSGRQPDYEDDYFVIFRYPSVPVLFSEILEKE
ncbi:MAG: hypothetical protein LBC27_05990 [Spirochaetaceae bacterium]|jgi:hypothetical protein|nr:hypothetical protein [Spirochaetaceae bacterium]